MSESVALWSAGITFAIIGFFFVRTLTGIDNNQSLLADSLKEGLAESRENFKEAFQRIGNLEIENAAIKAAHEINHHQ
jgi:hypothetical protein